MLNAYPDSMGGKLSDIVAILSQNAMKDVFGSFYILPSIYHSDLDRGFSVIDYELNEELAEWQDLEELKKLGIDLKLDFILNHASAQSPQFTDLVQHGDQSEYKDFFINWNDFWQGYGSAYHRCWVYRFCGFRYIFRRIGGTWKRHSFITDFPLPVCSGYHSGCVFTQQAFRSSWRLECVLDHGSDYRDHIPFHLPQGNRKTHNGGPKAMNIVLLHYAG